MASSHPLNHDDWPPPLENKKSVVAGRDIRQHTSAWDAASFDGEGWVIPLLCSGPNYAGGAHNFSSTWL